MTSSTLLQENLAQENLAKYPKESTSPLSEAEASALAAQLEGWELEQGGKRIVRRLKFKNFRESLAFVNRLGALAEAEKHHPDISFGWGYAEVVYTTHDIGGLHRNDFIIAAKTNALLEA